LICINLTTSIPISLQLRSRQPWEQPEAQLARGMPGASEMENQNETLDRFIGAAGVADRSKLKR